MGARRRPVAGRREHLLFNAVALAAVPPFTIVVSRLTLGAALLYLAAHAVGARMPIDRASWRAFAVMGVFNNIVPFSLIIWSQNMIPGGLASILTATAPLFTVLIAHVANKDEQMTVAGLGGAILGFCGVVVLVGADVFGDVGASPIAELAVLAAAICSPLPRFMAAVSRAAALPRWPRRPARSPPPPSSPRPYLW